MFIPALTTGLMDDVLVCIDALQTEKLLACQRIRTTLASRRVLVRDLRAITGKSARQLKREWKNRIIAGMNRRIRIVDTVLLMAAVATNPNLLLQKQVPS